MLRALLDHKEWLDLQVRKEFRVYKVPRVSRDKLALLALLANKVQLVQQD